MIDHRFDKTPEEAANGLREVRLVLAAAAGQFVPTATRKAKSAKRHAANKRARQARKAAR